MSDKDRIKILEAAVSSLLSRISDLEDTVSQLENGDQGNSKKEFNPQNSVDMFQQLFPGAKKTAIPDSEIVCGEEFVPN